MSLNLFELLLKEGDFSKFLAKHPELSADDIASAWRIIKAAHPEPKIKRAVKSGTLDYLRVCFDGAAKGNPGPAAIGIFFTGAAGEVIREYGDYIGCATNNQAEYQAGIKAMEIAATYKPKLLEVYSDSELLVKQIKGIYKVKNPELQKLYLKLKNAMRDFNRIKIEHIPRTKNKEADELANLAVKKRGVVSKRTG